MYKLSQESAILLEMESFLSNRNLDQQLHKLVASGCLGVLHEKLPIIIKSGYNFFMG